MFETQKFCFKGRNDLFKIISTISISKNLCDPVFEDLYLIKILKRQGLLLSSRNLKHLLCYLNAMPRYLHLVIPLYAKIDFNEGSFSDVTSWRGISVFCICQLDYFLKSVKNILQWRRPLDLIWCSLNKADNLFV